MPATRLRSSMHIWAVRYLVEGAGKALVWRAAVNIRALLTAKSARFIVEGAAVFRRKVRPR